MIRRAFSTKTNFPYLFGNQSQRIVEARQSNSDDVNDYARNLIRVDNWALGFSLAYR